MILPGHEKLHIVWPKKSQRLANTYIWFNLVQINPVIYYMSDICQNGHIMANTAGQYKQVPDTMHPWVTRVQRQSRWYKKFHLPTARENRQTADWQVAV